MSLARKHPAFDPACRTLADHFLRDDPDLAHRADDLAQWLQEAVEDWFSLERLAIRRPPQPADRSQ